LEKDASDSTARPVAAAETALESTLETIDVETGQREVVRSARAHFEAPNWSRDGRELFFNQDGRLFRLPVEGGVPQAVDTGFATRLNNDHGFSPDGQWLAVSDRSQGDGRSTIYVLPSAGGTPRRVTAKAPSYWHGWSPDGRRLAYCAERGGAFDVYTIAVEGGEETRLTSAPGLDDGPDYSPDGEWIYFNSERTGTMHIWRMRPDGREQQQVTSDGHADWFPHPSPDGKRVVFLSYENDVTGHPPNKDVALRVMPPDGGEIRVLARLFGGQGTINVPSWSPDGSRVAFVSYRLAPP
jgi:Tol biopolymer transport system component